MKRAVLWRKNVLALVGAGYGTLLIVFGAMVWPGKMTPDIAYEVVKGPLMALIGGSLAIAKDLIPLDDEDKPVLSVQSPESEPENGQPDEERKQEDEVE